MMITYTKSDLSTIKIEKVVSATTCTRCYMSVLTDLETNAGTDGWTDQYGDLCIQYILFTKNAYIIADTFLVAN